MFDMASTFARVTSDRSGNMGLYRSSRPPVTKAIDPRTMNAATAANIFLSTVVMSVDSFCFLWRGSGVSITFARIVQMGPFGFSPVLSQFLHDSLPENDRNYGQLNVRYTLKSGH